MKSQRAEPDFGDIRDKSAVFKILRQNETILHFIFISLFSLHFLTLFSQPGCQGASFAISNCPHLISRTFWYKNLV